MLDTVIPDFSLPATGGQPFQLSAQAGKVVVLYFYPKDNTPGCTTQAQQFRDMHSQFEAAGAVIVGVSRDSLKSHENFKSKYNLPFTLICDADEILCTTFSVIKSKMLYGKPVRGIERSTFLIDRHGVLRQEWRGVKVPDHAQAVLTAVQSL